MTEVRRNLATIVVLVVGCGGGGGLGDGKGATGGAVVTGGSIGAGGAAPLGNGGLPAQGGTASAGASGTTSSTTGGAAGGTAVLPGGGTAVLPVGGTALPANGGRSAGGGTIATGGSSVGGAGGAIGTEGTTFLRSGGTLGAGGIPGSGGTLGAGGISGSGGTLGAGGTAQALGCDKDLSGTWDLFASSTGTGIIRATLVISRDGFSFVGRSAELDYTATGTKSATWKHSGWDGQTTRLISVQNTPSTVSSGSIPLALGGQWTLTSSTETCVLNVAAGQVTGKCTGRAGDYNVGAADWPYELLDSPENLVTYSMSRSATAASQFGDFGGTWSAHSDTGSGQSCVFQLQNNTATSTCRTNTDFNGNLHLTVGADCVASGVTPSGAEVSARRH